MALVLALLQAVTPTGRITGKIVEARTGAPLAAVLVKVQASGQQALSDADGRFEVADVPEGRQVLLISVVGYGLVRREVVVSAKAAVEVTIPVSEGASGYVEAVEVGAPLFRQAESGVATQSVLGSRDLLALRGVIGDDPFRAVQVLPSVATGDDFKAEFAVRAQGPRHIGVAIDGIDSPLLFHTVRGVDDTASLGLINSDILQSATLLSGAYPQTSGSHLGARLDFVTRDGARDRLTARALLSGTAATTVWEGPFGREKHGAWIVAVRQSYLDWLLKKVDPDADGTFGFVDGHAKLTYDLSARQTLQASFIGGRSVLSESEESPGPNSLAEGHNSTMIGNIKWRFSPTNRWSVTQQVYWVEGHYQNTVVNGGVREQGRDRDVTWRATVDATISAHQFIHFGGQAQWLSAERIDHNFTPGAAGSNVQEQAADGASAVWMHYRWSPAATLLVAPGVRVDHFGLFDSTELSPWLLSEWQATATTKVRASFGTQHQAPAFEHALVSTADSSGRNPVSLVPEQAVTFDIGIERRMRDVWSVRLTGYARDESKGLRFENSELRVANGRIVRPSSPSWANSLQGKARGVEATVERRVTNGISGWLTYAYGTANTDDAATGESYSSDYDQTHAINAYAIYRPSNKLGLSARFRYGSNFPVQGYFEQVGETYYLGTERNSVRFPDYARLDLRADRAFTYRRSRLTLFVEVLNTFNRRNLAAGDWAVNGATGVVRDLVEKGFPFLPSAGVLIEF